MQKQHFHKPEGRGQGNTNHLGRSPLVWSTACTSPWPWGFVWSKIKSHWVKMLYFSNLSGSTNTNKISQVWIYQTITSIFVQARCKRCAYLDEIRVGGVKSNSCIVICQTCYLFLYPMFESSILLEHFEVYVSDHQRQDTRISKSCEPKKNKKMTLESLRHQSIPSNLKWMACKQVHLPQEMLWNAKLCSASRTIHGIASLVTALLKLSHRLR